MQFDNPNAVVKPTDSFDHWHQVTCRDFSLTECRRIPSDRFRAQIVIRALGDLKASDIWSHTAPGQSIRVERSLSDTRKDPRDYFMLWLALRGNVTFAQSGRIAQMTSGDITLHDQAQPFSLDFADDCRALMISIPRPLLVSRLPKAPDLTARTVHHRSALAALAGSMMRHMMSLQDARDDIVERLNTSILDVLATTLSAELGLVDDDGQDQRLRDVKRYLLAHLEDGELTLAAIANTQNISPRTLNRLFAIEGTTPMRWLWEQRLLASHRALTQRQARHVTEAAYRFGFSDVSHFSRAFKKRFGQPPHTLLR